MYFSPLIILSFILLIPPNCANSELNNKKRRGCFDFYTYANEGYCSYLLEDYKTSIDNYKKAFELRIQGCNVSDYRNDHYLYAKALVHSGLYEKGQKFLHYSILYGELNWKDIVQDPILSPHNIDGRIISKPEFDSLKAKRNSKMNSDLRTVIDSMVFKDQYYRLMAKDILESKIDSIKNLQLIIDDQNEAKLKSIIAKHGFPGLNKIGTDKANILLMHMSYEDRHKIFPKLIEEVNKGAINPDILGMMIDQELVLEKGRIQKYGYFLERDEMYNTYFMPFKTSNLDSINEYRKQIGAISLECSAVKNGAKMPYMFELEYSPER